MAATYYVDSVAGSESNNGTSISTPWKTLTTTSKVNTVIFQPGDQVLFKRGSAWSGYLIPNGSGTSTAQIVFDAYGDPAAPLPIINGNGIAAVRLWNKRYVTFQNFKITNTGTGAGGRSGIRLFYNSPGSYPGVRILDNEITDVVGYTTRGSGLENYTTAGIYIEFFDGQCLVDDLRIEGNYIHDVKAMGIHVRPGSFMSGHPEYWMTNFVIRNNTIMNMGGDHIVVQGADAPLIEYNAGYDAGALAVPNANLWIAGMWVCYHTRNSLFQFNEVARTITQFVGGNGDSMAFDVDYGTIGNHIFQYNYTHDNAGGAVLMMPHAPIQNTNPQQYYPPAEKTIVYRYNISVNDDRNNANGRQVIMNTAAGINSAHIYNNVFYNNRPLGLKVSDTAAEYYTNNVFYASQAHYGSLPRFTNNSYYGHIPRVNDPYKVLSDPRFVGPLPGTGPVADAYLTVGNITSLNDIFKLQPNSPLINAGKSITTPISNGGRDFWNNPLYASTHADIGVHEVVGGVGAPPSAVTMIDGINAAPITYSSGWTFVNNNASFDNSTVALSSTVGNWAQCSFTGTNVTLVGLRGPGSGRFNVSINGGPATLVDLYWPIALQRQEVFTVTGLPNTTNTIRITVATKNPVSTWTGVHLDYFQVAPGNPPAPAAVVVADDTAGTYTGAWTASTTAANGYLKTLHSSGTVGDSISFTFTGTGVRLYGPKDQDRGNLNVTVNGVTRLVSSFCPGEWDEVASVLYEINGLPQGTHTLTATVATKDANSLGQSVAIDFIEQLTGGFTAPLPPVAVDNPPGAAVVYTGSWTHSADAGFYNGTKSVSSTLGNYVTFTFTGTGVSLYAKKDSGLGKLNVQIDNGTATSVDCYSTSQLLQQKVFEISGLPPGTHTLKATVALKNPASASNFIGLDYFQYQP
ncbi:MAG: hypothetical protein K0R17_2643 [Rariglobus sp.]|nr:hypothetical protein [Rariglobus sp.]